MRPLPLGGVWKGLRLTGFIDDDHYVESAKRQRAIGQVTFEHPLVNAGFDYLTAKDQTLATQAEVEAKGWSVWATPKLGTTGWEALLRHDDFKPNKSVDVQKRKRDIVGIAYWFPNLQQASRRRSWSTTTRSSGRLHARRAATTRATGSRCSSTSKGRQR